MSLAHLNLAAADQGRAVDQPDAAKLASDSVSDESDSLSDERTVGENHQRFGILRGGTAVGYYLSVLLHSVAFGIAFVLFAYFGPILFNDDASFVIRASLDDMTVQDENPRLEIVPELSMGTNDGQSNIERISSNLKAVENGLIDTAAADMLPSMLSSKDANDDTGGGGFLFKLPESGLAVTKGSFTAWTEPEIPEVGKPYLIIIEVRLPKAVKGYRINDLSGTVKGTDGYTQSIPFDANQRNSSFYTDENVKHRIRTGSESVKVRSNRIQLGVAVPGARRLVRDTIQIRSRRLREKQQLELVFGGSSGR
ncbi:MAG: hypothetical protein GY903_17710 [Fuerstiella sp.]|nr:hypothetical protein [Fuerstiella sp.]MCP4856321.1 hypothetical protein [Fuerstiella sp.]